MQLVTVVPCPFAVPLWEESGSVDKALLGSGGLKLGPPLASSSPAKQT